MGHEFLGGAFDFSVLKINFAIQIQFHMKKILFTFVQWYIFNFFKKNLSIKFSLNIFYISNFLIFLIAFLNSHRLSQAQQGNMV